MGKSIKLYCVGDGERNVAQTQYKNSHMVEQKCEKCKEGILYCEKTWRGVYVFCDRCKEKWKFSKNHQYCLNPQQEEYQEPIYTTETKEEEYKDHNGDWQMREVTTEEFSHYEDRVRTISCSICVHCLCIFTRDMFTCDKCGNHVHFYYYVGEV